MRNRSLIILYIRISYSLYSHIHYILSFKVMIPLREILFKIFSCILVDFSLENNDTEGGIRTCHFSFFNSRFSILSAQIPLLQTRVSILLVDSYLWILSSQMGYFSLLKPTFSLLNSQFLNLTSQIVILKFHFSILKSHFSRFISQITILKCHFSILKTQENWIGHIEIRVNVNSDKRRLG